LYPALQKKTSEWDHFVRIVTKVMRGNSHEIIEEAAPAMKPKIKEVTWRIFAENKVLLLFLYALYWLFVGIYLGHGYGFKAKRVQQIGKRGRINGD
jgi:hypothetical protein